MFITVYKLFLNYRVFLAFIWFYVDSNSFDFSNMLKNLTSDSSLMLFWQYKNIKTLIHRILLFFFCKRVSSDFDGYRNNHGFSCTIFFDLYE